MLQNFEISYFRKRSSSRVEPIERCRGMVSQNDVRCPVEVKLTASSSPVIAVDKVERVQSVKDQNFISRNTPENTRMASWNSFALFLLSLLVLIMNPNPEKQCVCLIHFATNTQTEAPADDELEKSVIRILINARPPSSRFDESCSKNCVTSQYSLLHAMYPRKPTKMWCRR